jgi:hypothetical protein
MIFFIPAYDEATRTNLAVIKPILPQEAVSLLAEQAIRANLWFDLPNHDLLFVMSHGNSDKIWGHDDKPALTSDDKSLFEHKKAFVFACYTANELGMVLKKYQNIYWGYTGAIAAPSQQPHLIEFFRTIFKHIVENFPNCSDAASIMTLIEAIKLLCHQMENEFDLLFEAGEDIDIINYTCLLHIWSRLRVYHFEEDDPIQHASAKDGYIFE